MATQESKTAPPDQQGRQDGMKRVRTTWGLRIPLCTDEWEMEGERWNLVSLFSAFYPVARK